MAGAREKTALTRSTGHAPPTPLATAAALDLAVFSKIHALDAIPATWEERGSITLRNRWSRTA